MVDTPLTKDQLYHLTENYGRFVIRDVRRGSLRFYQGQPLSKKIVYNIDPKSIFTVLGGLFVLYKLYKIKKDIGKTVNKANPFQNNINDFEDTLNTWNRDTVPSDEEEEEFASA
jgi:hypothetical protein